MTTEKIYIGIDDKVIEAKGEVLESLLEEIEAMKTKQAAWEASVIAKEAARVSLIEKLAALGITEEEAKAIGQ